MENAEQVDPCGERPVGLRVRDEAEEENSSEVQSLLARIRKGDEAAVSELFKGYEERLSRLAEARIRRESDQGPKPDVRAESIVQSRLVNFVTKVKEGRYGDTKSPVHLWNILAKYVSRGAENKIRKAWNRPEKRHWQPFHGDADSSGNARLGAVDRIVDHCEQRPGEPDTDELIRNLVDSLEGNANVRRTLELLWDGVPRTNNEIASILGCSRRSVDIYCEQIRKAIKRVAEA